MAVSQVESNNYYRYDNDSTCDNNFIAFFFVPRSQRPLKGRHCPSFRSSVGNVFGCDVEQLGASFGHVSVCIVKFIRF